MMRRTSILISSPELGTGTHYTVSSLMGAALSAPGFLRSENLSRPMTLSNENHALDDPAIYGKLTAIFRAIFEDDGIVLRPETSEADIAGWDSFSNASLIAAMEKEFGIRFRIAELQSLHCVANFVDLIRAKLPSGG